MEDNGSRDEDSVEEVEGYLAVLREGGDAGESLAIILADTRKEDAEGCEDAGVFFGRLGRGRKRAFIFLKFWKERDEDLRVELSPSGSKWISRIPPGSRDRSVP